MNGDKASHELKATFITTEIGNKVCVYLSLSIAKKNDLGIDYRTKLDLTIYRPSYSWPINIKGAVIIITIINLAELRIS